MPAYEPQPQALIEATRDGHAEHCGEGCPVTDMLTELLHLRTQAARLAAVQPVADAALAWWGARGHPFEAEAMAELARVVAVYHDSGAWQAALQGAGDGC
jgi:hypothetical protein